MLILGNIFGGIGDVLGGISGAIQDIPVLGDIAPFAVGAIPGIGPIASAAMGALAGGGAEGALQGIGSQQILSSLQQQQADSQRARELVNAGLDFSNQGIDVARGEFQADAPLRDAFRTGAMNFSDPTNPFTQFQPSLQAPQQAAPQASAVPQGFGALAQGAVQGAQPSAGTGAGGGIPGNARQDFDVPGSFRNRVRQRLRLR